VERKIGLSLKAMAPGAILNPNPPSEPKDAK
jgi:hypothetical protein